MSLLSDDPLQIGYYVTSTRIIELVVGLPVLLISVVMPVLTVAARDDRARLDYVAARLTEVMALGGVLFAIVLGLGAEPLVRLLGGAAYLPAAGVLQIQSVVLISVFVTAAWSPVLLGMGRVRELAGVTAIGVASVLAAGLVLIPARDADGAAIAAVAADVVVCAAMFIAVYRAGPGRGLDGGRLARIALAGALAVGAGSLPGIPPVVAAIGAGALFVGLAWLLGAVPAELRATLRAPGAGYAGRR